MSNQFKILLPKPQGCAPCALWNGGQGFSQPEGTGALDVLIVGEALGEHEEEEGLPFRPGAQAGSVLERAIKIAGYDREQFALWNIVACRPPRNFLDGAPWEHDAINECKQHFRAVMDRFKPKVILALGNIAARTLTGMTGKGQGITAIRGFVLPAKDYPGVWVIPSMHPSFLKRGKMSYLGMLIRELKLAVDVAQNGFPETPGAVYSEYPSIEEAAAFLEDVRLHPELPLGYDIETDYSPGQDEHEVIVGGLRKDREDGEEEEELPEEEPVEELPLGQPRHEAGSGKNIVLIQFSLRPGEGIAFPWTPDYAHVAKQILALPNDKIGFNCFHRNTSVQLGNGTWKNIADIRAGELVRSVAAGEIVSRKVLAQIHTKDDRPWVEVKIDGAYESGVGRWGNRGIVCTLDHEWVTTEDSRVQAANLAPGQEVVLSQWGDSRLLEGSILGDASATVTGRFIVGHSNYGWLEAKAKALGTTIQEKQQATGGFAVPGTKFWGTTAAIPKFWHKLYYNLDGSRIWRAPRTTAALAVFYGDDGTLRACGTAGFAICRYASVAEDIRKWFAEKFGSAAISGTENPTVYLHRESSDKFFEEIAPWIHPSMEYKLPTKYRSQYNGWMETPRPQIGRVISVAPINRPGQLDKHKYCLEVEGTHTFFTRGGLVQNCYHFDDVILEDNGCEIAGKRFDLMWYFHHSQPDLPRGLQSVTSFYVPGFGPWKHLASVNLANYGCRDVDVLQRIWAKLPIEMRKLRVWEGAEKHIREFWPLLQETSARGLPIAKLAQDQFRAELAEEIEVTDREMQIIHPDELKNLSPKNGYVRDPKDTTGLVQREFEFSARPKILCECVEDSGEITGWSKKVIDRCPLCGGTGYYKPEQTCITKGLRWVKLLPFKASKQQLIKYMRYKKHPVPKAIGDRTKESTAKAQLERLAKRTRDPFYDKLLRLRAIKKMKSSYVDTWVPGPDGRLHATFSFSPATGQLAAFGPNILTTPSKKLGIIGEKFQRTIEAPEGYVLGAFDFSGFHTATLALEAEDAVYMRIAKIDPHSFLTSVVKHLKSAEEMMAMKDDELKDFLGYVKENFGMERDKKSKPAILGIGFGLGAKGLYERYEENYANVGECKMIIDTIKGIFPGVANYQKAVRMLAHKQKFLWNRHGFIRWFWDVMHVDPETGQAVGGDQAEAAIAFNPACDAHGHIKDALKRLRAQGLTEKYGLVNIVHDEGLFCWPKALTDEAVEVVTMEMEKPSEILRSPLVAPEGLSVAVEAKIGLNRWELMSPKKFKEKFGL